MTKKRKQVSKSLLLDVYFRRFISCHHMQSCEGIWISSPCPGDLPCTWANLSLYHLCSMDLQQQFSSLGTMTWKLQSNYHRCQGEVLFLVHRLLLRLPLDYHLRSYTQAADSDDGQLRTILWAWHCHWLALDHKKYKCGWCSGQSFCWY